MYINTKGLDECEIHTQPVLALSHGELQRRVITFSPYLVPQPDGMALLGNTAGKLELVGVHLNAIEFGDPDAIIRYLGKRFDQEGIDIYFHAYGRSLEILRGRTGWLLELGGKVVATFDKGVSGTEICITNLQLRDGDSSSNRRVCDKLAELAKSIL